LDLINVKSVFKIIIGMSSTPIGVEKGGKHKVMMGCSTRQHSPRLKAIILRVEATTCRGDRKPRQETGRIMETVGEKNGGDQSVQQGIGGGISTRAGAGMETENPKSGKVAKSESGWQRDPGHRLRRKQEGMAEGGRKERLSKEGEERNIWREQERMEEEEGNCREGKMETGKEECRVKVTFEVGQSNRSNNKG